MNRRDPSRLFLWFVYAFIVLIWYEAVFGYGLRQSPWLIPFTVLAALHGGLHGALLLVGNRSRGVKALYLVVQLVVAAGLVLMARQSPLSQALFFPLAGEAIGLFADVRGRLAGVGGVVAGWLAVTLLIGDWAMLRVMLPASLASFGFVGVYVWLYARQMMERQRAENLLVELEQVNRQLRSYARRVEELTIAEERQRMARELHDTLAQGLAGLVLQLEAVDDLLARGEAERARAITVRAMQRARTTLAEARTAIQALRTPLEKGNVVGAIQELVDNLRAETGLTCIFEAGPGDLRLEGEVGAQVYRVVKEGLTNIQRHAQASQAAVRLTATPEHIQLEITDDGVGFDPDAIPTGHYGLLGLRERTGLLGGTLMIDSRPGTGTRIQVTLPAAPGALAEEED
ncbi:MAG TPA: sensor histidine kinase [Symbiobacteriaceae bacterium]